MSKLLNSILDRVSENNNDYRNILRTLNASLEEKTATLIGDVVTASNYTIDFSNALNESKEKLSEPISKIIESYVIKDLRSVETVNEQFVEKINDKLEEAKITSKEEKDAFSSNLNNLLNNKYLEIVKIKRVDFTDENNQNVDIENCINDFASYLNNTVNFDQTTLNKILTDYKNDVYFLISSSLKQISDLYLNNFVNEVSSALNSVIDVDKEEYEKDNDTFKPFIPDINPVSDINIPQVPSIEENSIGDSPDANFDEPKFEFEIPKIDEVEQDVAIDKNMENPLPSHDEVKQSEDSYVAPIEVEPVAPVEVKEEPNDVPKRPYDVEEILKIAKSPIVAQPEDDENKDDMYIKVDPIVSESEQENLDSEFNERQIVEEMISRLTKRLEKIDERRNKYNEEQAKLQEDEAFVNDLIQSAKNKKQELDNFEKELDDKEKELNDKQKELDRKINDVMPFANAVLNAEEES